MRGHIVRPFVIMAVIGVVFLHCLIEKHLKINPNRRISIFVYRERSRSMLDKYLAYTGGDITQFRYGLQNFTRDEMKTASAFLENNIFLENLHAGLSERRAWERTIALYHAAFSILCVLNS